MTRTIAICFVLVTGAAMAQVEQHLSAALLAEHTGAELSHVEELFRKAVDAAESSKEQDQVTALLGLARVLRAQGKTEEADRFIGRAAEVDPEDPRVGESPKVQEQPLDQLVVSMLRESRKARRVRSSGQRGRRSVILGKASEAVLALGSKGVPSLEKITNGSLPYAELIGPAADTLFSMGTEESQAAILRSMTHAPFVREAASSLERWKKAHRVAYSGSWESRLVHIGLSSQDANIAAEYLGDATERQVDDEMAADLVKSPFSGVRNFLAGALGIRGSRISRAHRLELAQQLLKDPVLDVRLRVALALPSMSAFMPTEVESLVRQMFGDESQQVRDRAWATAARSFPNLREEYLPTIIQEKDTEILRTHLSYILGVRPNENEMRVLLRLLDRPEAAARRPLYDMLNRWPAGSLLLQPEVQQKILESVMRDGAENAPESGIEFLVRNGDRSIIEALAPHAGSLGANTKRLLEVAERMDAAEAIPGLVKWRVLAASSHPQNEWQEDLGRHLRWMLKHNPRACLDLLSGDHFPQDDAKRVLRWCRENLTDELVGDYVDACIQAPSTEAQEAILRNLSPKAGRYPRMLEHLRGVVGSSDLRVAAAAASALGTFGDLTDAERAVRVLTGVKGVRSADLAAPLQRLIEAGRLEAVNDLLASHQSLQIHAVTVCETPGENARNLILQSLSDDSPPEVRSAILYNLNQRSPLEQAIEDRVIGLAAGSNLDVETARGVLRFLGKTRNQKHADLIVDLALEHPEAERLVGHSPQKVRRFRGSSRPGAGVAALYELGSEVLLKAAPRFLADDASAFQAKGMLAALTCTEGEEAGDLIIKGLSHPCAEVRKTACTAVKQLLLVKARPELMRLLRDPEVREFASQALRYWSELGVRWDQ